MNTRDDQRARYVIAAASFALAAACGGRSASSPAIPDASTTTSASPVPEAGVQPDAAPAFDAGFIGSLLEDAGHDSSTTTTSPQCDGGTLDGEVPVSHRPSGSTCPARAPGGVSSGCAYDAGVACLNDSDCTSGTNGRCLSGILIPPPPPCETPQCSYDQCESDSDCPAGVPCDCRGSSDSNEPNICATGSNCRTDSDCGTGGYCSPGGYSDFTCSEPIFFCHGPADTCINDTDCCGSQRQCTFDTALGHFECGYGCVPPP